RVNSVSLYTNDREHPDVLLKTQNVTSNQHYYKWEYMASWMAEQNENNKKVDEKIAHIVKLHRKLNARQRGEAMKVDERLDMLEEASEVNKKMGMESIEGVTMLDARTKEITHLLEDSQQSRDQLSEKIELLTKMNDSIIQQLDESVEARKELTNQINDLSSIQTHLTEQIATSKSQQEKVMKKLDNHEALLEKLSRQMNQFRSIVYERIHFLQEKIEDSYKFTAAYIYNLLEGGNQSFTMQLQYDEKEKVKKDSS
ncbi:MAG TPA: hypothetical protein VK142_12185, partial [Bacillota bacterium]|nr:hypothetical protein [Bacillota bacterium]